MPEFYKTSKGYCYKKTQKGGASRISTDAYEKAMVKQKGGVESVVTMLVQVCSGS